MNYKQALFIVALFEWAGLLFLAESDALRLVLVGVFAAVISLTSVSLYRQNRLLRQQLAANSKTIQSLNEKHERLFQEWIGSPGNQK